MNQIKEPIEYISRAKSKPIRMPAADFENFAESGWYFQLTLGRRLMDIEHFHDYYEIICVISGECTHKVCGRAFAQTSGELILLKPGDTHCFTHQSPGTNIASLSVMAHMVEPFLLAYDIEAIPEKLAMSGTQLADYKRLCESIFALASGERIPLCRVLLGQICKAVLIDRMPRGISQSSTMPASFADALERMNELENAAEGIPAFLRLSNFSHAQLCRLTKKHLGKSPGEFVNAIRMRYALELVRGGELDCESVGEAVGFGSYSHFCALFVKTFGITPSSARKEALESLKTV